VTRNTSDLHQLLAPVDDAAYTSRAPVSACLQGTRDDVIGEIVLCVKKGDRPICWLSGSAGSGKSAVSQTIAKRYDDKDRLLASFFFLRGAGGRSTIARLIPTLAYQLSISDPATEPLIRDVIRKEPAIFSQSLTHQFTRLITEPIMAARKSILARLPWTKPAVLVIDALDECDDKDLMAEFIGVIIGIFQANRRLPFRVVFTSRVEEHIRQKLETPAARSVVHRLSLDSYDAHRDLHRFFQTRFSTIYEENHRVMRDITLPWPSERELDTLVKKSDGLFIFATTLMNFFDEGDGLPQEKLQSVLELDAGLDPLYMQVLSNAVHDHNFERVIGTVVLIREPLSITFLGRLLRLRTGHIIHSLLGTQSILMIPEDDNQAIQPFHTSLPDFLKTESSSGKFFIDPPRHHLFILTDCLATMIVHPTEDIFYGGEQLYACMNWCYHFCQAFVEGREDAIVEVLAMDVVTHHLEDLASSSLQFWVNTLILKGWGKPLGDLTSLLARLKVCTMCVVCYAETI
jgi:AAA ATPase domain